MNFSEEVVNSDSIDIVTVIIRSGVLLVLQANPNSIIRVQFVQLDPSMNLHDRVSTESRGSNTLVVFRESHYFVESARHEPAEGLAFEGRLQSPDLVRGVAVLVRR